MFQISVEIFLVNVRMLSSVFSWHGYCSRTLCEHTAKLIQSVSASFTLGHMCSHTGFTRPPGIECFSVLQCMVHSTTLDPGIVAISGESLLGLICSKPVTCVNELWLRVQLFSLVQGPS